MTLYIYRVEWTYQARNPIIDLNIQKVLVVLEFQLDRSDRSDSPVRPIGQSDRRFAGSEIGPTSQTTYGHRSGLVYANFGRQYISYEL